MLLGATPALSVDGERQVVSLDHSALPTSVDRIVLRNLRAGAGSEDLEVHRLTGDTVAVVATRREGEVELRSLK